eukprot:4979294-Heterocapsa_arctica.AAC.1
MRRVYIWEMTTVILHREIESYRTCRQKGSKSHLENLCLGKSKCTTCSALANTRKMDMEMEKSKDAE